MEPVTFPEVNITIAKDQPQYRPLPSHVDSGTPEKIITFCWRLNWKERLQLLVLGRIWQQVLSFGHPLQPQLLHTRKPVLLDDARDPQEWAKAEDQ